MTDIGTIAINEKQAPRLGVGTWAIGGPFFAGDMPIGWGEVDDAQSKAMLEAAYDAGLRVFDTADVYGAGRSEDLLGEVFGNRDDVIVSTKFGNGFEIAKKQITGERYDAAYIRQAVDASRRRLRRDCIDLLFLHLNSLPLEEAGAVFDTLDVLVGDGAVASYGWSTDFPERAALTVKRKHAVAIQHAMNVFLPASAVRAAAGDLMCFNRSPLAMGFLSEGVLNGTKQISESDVRNSGQAWIAYFQDGKPNPDFLERLRAVANELKAGRNSLVEGALAYILGKSSKTVPIPGIKTEAQLKDIVGVLETGPMPDDQIARIEALLPPESDVITER